MSTTGSRPAPEIPGFYFDASRKKYFKIQANHIATPGSEYSKEAVNIKREVQQNEEQLSALQTRQQNERIRPSLLRKHPLFDFERRLGTRGYSSGTGNISQYYCAALDERQWLWDGMAGYYSIPLRQFAYDESRQSLIGTHPYDHDPCEKAFPDGSGKVLLLPNPMHHASLWYSSTEILLLRLTALAVVASGYNGTVRVMDLNDQYSRVIETWSKYDVRSLDAAPDERHFAMATTEGLYITQQGDSDFFPTEPYAWTTKEQMAVSFKDNNTVMSGARNGTVLFADVRSRTPTTRLQHSSAVSAIRSLKNDNYILVNGLNTMSIYDLRYSKQPTRPSLPSRRKKYHSQQNPTAAAATTPTEPYLSFHISPCLGSNGYGNGFDYDPDLNLVAVASSRSHNHRVALYSTQTGRAVKSPLNDRAFQDYVTCIKFARLKGEGAPKSLLLAIKGKVVEWAPWGSDGEESEQDEKMEDDGHDHDHDHDGGSG